MADHDDWTADDDAQLRAALTSLRADVEAAPLPDVRFVKARGMARRRQQLLTWTAAAAAAAVVVGTVGYSQFGREAAGPLVPATRSGTTSAAPSPTTTDPLDQPGALPLLTDWTRTLALPGTVLLTPMKEVDSVDCDPPLPPKSARAQAQELTGDELTFSAMQLRYSLGSADKASAAGDALRSALLDCTAMPFDVKDVDGGPTTPEVLSYTGPGDAAGWYVIASFGPDLAYLSISANADKALTATQAQVESIAKVAQARLERYGSKSTTTSTPTTTGGSGPKAINEKMPVTGPAPTPSSNLFVAASQWTDPLFANGAKAFAGKGDPQDTLGDIGVFCETPDLLAGVGGRLGEVEVRAGSGDANVIGHQRVRVDDADTGTPAGKAMASAAVASQLGEEQATLVRGCTETDGKVTATKGPTEGTFLLTKEVTGEATGKQFQWVGDAPLTTHGAWTTVVFHGTNDGQGFTGSAAEGFAELDRLLALARQK